jgi:hypothetical protein
MTTQRKGSCLGVSVLFSFAAAFGGCGIEVEDGVADPNGPDLFSDTDSLTNYNGLAENGLGSNGLNANGLNTNGLNANGLNANGLNANGLFKTWFVSTSYKNQPQVMKYLIECALPAGQTTGYGGYTWTGRLGVAGTWYGGAPTGTQQRNVSACMMAHVNADGRHITVSFRGPALSASDSERSTYGKEEGTYFGNLIAGTPRKFVCSSPYASYAAATYGRRCALNPSVCGMVAVGSCSLACATRTSQGAWTDCTGTDGIRYGATITAWVK